MAEVGNLATEDLLNLGEQLLQEFDEIVSSN